MADLSCKDCGRTGSIFGLFEFAIVGQWWCKACLWARLRGRNHARPLPWITEYRARNGAD